MRDCSVCNCTLRCDPLNTATRRNARRSCTVQAAKSKLRMMLALGNVLDFIAFVPPLVELLMASVNVPFNLGRFDLRWIKILRY